MKEKNKNMYMSLKDFSGIPSRRYKNEQKPERHHFQDHELEIRVQTGSGPKN